MNTESNRVLITDVAPRDGLQNQKVPVSTEQKVELIRRLASNGVSSIEVTSFVSPKAVPQMADAADVLAGSADLQPAVRLSTLVPNVRGFERALASGAQEVAVVLSATETMNQRNINMSLEQATQVSRDVVVLAREAGLRNRAYIAVAFECPYEGLTSLDAVLSLSEQMLAAGAEEIVIADTIGAASPAQVDTLLKELAGIVPIERTAMHFHATRGMGLANAWAALQRGVRRFDASVGGIGGCPFAPGAAGNLATEDLVVLAHQCGYDTGIDLDGLMQTVAFAESFLNQKLGGHSANWLRRPKK